MPSKPRNEIFDPHNVGAYHCFSRCVRSEHLCGFDILTGNDYGYRREWIVSRLKTLSASMALDVLDFSVLENHLHTLLRNRPDIVATWSDEEVARRWWNVCPGRKEKDGTPKTPRQSEIDAWINEPGKIHELRARLSHISWFMRLLLQPIAKRANKEDEKRGRFFAERFGCTKIENEAGLLACSMYVALNPIRAGMADRPDQYRFTSVYERIKSHQHQSRAELKKPPTSDLTDRPIDDWLAPLFLNEKSDTFANDSFNGSDMIDPPCNPIGSARISNKGYLHITFDDYLTTLEWTGRRLETGKPIRIPCHLEPIFERLNISPKTWIMAVKYFPVSALQKTDDSKRRSVPIDVRRESLPNRQSPSALGP